MIEKFSDYESVGFIDKEGEFVFEIVDYELKDSSKGTPMAVFNVKSDEGTSTIYHSLNPKARWSYNNLIKACLKLDSKEKIAAFECDYELIGAQLVGKKFVGIVTAESYDKEIKIPQDDGTFITDTVTKESFKITEYAMCK